jgi:membrane protease YdiL (CAAX protease family)
METIFSISALSATIGYAIYMHLASSEIIKKIFSPQPDDNTIPVLYTRFNGMIIFGLIPFLVIYQSTDIPFSLLGFSGFTRESLLWITVFLVVIVPVNFLNSKSAENLKMYPQIRKKEWSKGLMLLSALSWVLYLFAYEFLFRGVLLFSSLELLGYWPAILLNAGIYSLAHYPKGPKETYGAIPWGIVMSVLSIKTGSIWIAFFGHVILALSNEWYSLWFHETIRLKRAKQ